MRLVSVRLYVAPVFIYLFIIFFPALICFVSLLRTTDDAVRIKRNDAFWKTVANPSDREQCKWFSCRLSIVFWLLRGARLATASGKNRERFGWMGNESPLLAVSFLVSPSFSAVDVFMSPMELCRLGGSPPAIGEFHFCAIFANFNLLQLMLSVCGREIVM